MGFFTWTLANKKPRLLKSGDYAKSCVLQYDGYGAIVCPDDTLIEEPCYEGYGIFDGKDVYELVLDWNKPHLMDILKDPRFVQSNAFIISKEQDIYEAYARDDKTALDAAIAKAAVEMPYLAKDWKRSLGIAIACGKNNAIIPFPIKIVDTKNPKPYAELPPSIDTQ